MFLKRDEVLELHNITALPYEYCGFESKMKKMLFDKPKSFNPSIFREYGSLIGAVRGEPVKEDVLDYVVKHKGYSYDNALFKFNKSSVLSGRSTSGNARFFMRGI